MSRKPSKNKPYTFILETKPTPKGRPRMTRRGRVYTPATTLQAEAELKAAYGGPLYEGPVSLDVTYSPTKVVITVTPLLYTTPSKLRGDLDNYIKLTMDSLNGVAWADDKQVHTVIAEKVQW